MSGKQTPREIILLHTDRSDRVARLVQCSVSHDKYPIVRRNIRWWSGHPEYYLLVFSIGVRRSDAPSGSNCQKYKYRGYGSYYREMRDDGHEATAQPKKMFQESSAADIARKIQSILDIL